MDLLCFLGITFSVVQSASCAAHRSTLPQIYQYDDFKSCQARYTEFSYCVVNVELLPDETNRLWNAIHFLTSNRNNFPHDRLERGLCVNKLHVGKMDEREVENVVRKHISNQIYSKYGLYSRTKISSCWTSGSMAHRMTNSERAFVCISLCLVVITIYATWQDHSVGTGGLLKEAFAFQQNWRRITQAPSGTTLPFLDGLRAIGMLTILIVHSQLPMIRMPVKNPEDLEAQANHFLFPLINSGNTHMIQFFFALGGMVFGLSCLNHFESSRTFDGTYFIEKLVRRLLRVLPAYGFVILYHATWYRRVKRGPLEFKFNDYCSANWWTNVLFINNYVHPTEPYGWYLGADMHLFLMGSVLLYLVWRFPCTKRVIVAVMFVSALAVPGIVIYVKSTSATMTFDMRHALAELRTYDHFINFYLPSHTNVAGYFFGIIAALAYKEWLYMNDELQRDVRRTVQRAFVISATALVGLNAFTMVLPALNISPTLSLFHAIYGSLLKASWGCCYGVLFLVLALKGESLFVGLLSHPLMQFLSKLSYCVYIVQYSVIYGVYTNFPIPLTYGPFNLMIITSATVLLSMISAFFLHITVEMPVGYFGNKILTSLLRKSKLSVATPTLSSSLIKRLNLRLMGT